MVYNDNFLMPINEVYFGRTKEVEDIIKQIGLIRKKAGVEVGSGGIIKQKYNPVINTWPETIKLNRMLESMFGFSVCNLNIIPSMQANAFTTPLDTFSINATFIHKPKDMITKTKNGFKYKKEADYGLMINITSGLFLNDTITDAEIVSVLFHEIGHNFSSALSNKICIGKAMLGLYETIRQIIEVIIHRDGQAIGGLFAPILYSSDVSKVVSKATKKLQNSPVFKAGMIIKDSIHTIVDFTITTIDDVKSIGFIINPLGYILNIWNYIHMLEKIPVMIFSGYRDEQFADAFAGMYGLGSEMASCEAKIPHIASGIIDKAIFKTPIIGTIFNIIKCPLDFVNMLFDEHPASAARIKLQIDLLENELKNENMDPKMKNRIKKEIDSIKKEFNENIKLNGKIKELGDPLLIKRLYDTILMNIGGDLKAGIFKTSSVIKDIDDTADRLDNK